MDSLRSVMDSLRSVILLIGILVVVYRSSDADVCPSMNNCTEEYSTTLSLFHDGIIMCPYMADFVNCSAQSIVNCSMNTTLENIRLEKTLDEKCKRRSSVTIDGFDATPLWWVDLVKEIPGHCGTVDTCVQMTISQPNVYSCSSVMSTLACIENKTSDVCLRSSHTNYVKEETRFRNELKEDCNHCVEGIHCPEIATTVITEHMTGGLPCSSMKSSLSDIAKQQVVVDASIQEKLDLKFKEFKLVVASLCGTGNLIVNGRLLVLTTLLQTLWYIFSILLNEP